MFFSIDDALARQFVKAYAMKNVVAQNQACAVVTNEILANDKGLCQTIRAGLLGIFEVYSDVTAIAQETTETGKVVWRRDNENLTNACLHECRDGVVDHRLVKNRNQLLADTFRNGV